MSAVGARWRRWATLAWMISPCLAGAADENNDKSSGPVVVLPAPEPSDMGGQSQLPSLHLPGREYRPGDGWWALSCSDSCKLVAAKLAIKSLDHEQYEGPKVPGQLLQWSPAPPEGTLLMFKPFRAPADHLPLAAGPVKTYYAPGKTMARPRSAGTMEGKIDFSDGGSATVVPVLMMPKAGPNQPANGLDAPLNLELRVGNVHQMLGTFVFGMDGRVGLKPEDYIVWAGDIDGDGKLDLIIKTDFSGTNVALFLSSLAAPGEAVGLAGRFVYFPIESGGC